MAEPSKHRVTVKPPQRDWRLAETSAHGRRAALSTILDTLGLHDKAFDPARPVVATGHQAWFWHPGILAKDLAMAAACARLGAQPVHLVVDHIANPALTVDVPVRRGDGLAVVPLRLGEEDVSVCTGRRPPLRGAEVREAVARFEQGVNGEVLVDLSTLLDLPDGFDALGSLADSITAMQLHAVRKSCPEVFVLRTSELARLAAFGTMAERMLHDARRCVVAYNDAVAQIPQANVAPLLIEPDRVELPLWVVEKGGTLGPVFADLADTTPLLTREDGTPIESIVTEGVEHLPLAPKALTLTVFMRSTMCDLFIHGTGGGVYEQVTGQWWKAWVGESLAPLAVVSADVTLAFDAPAATREELARAVWFRHHLPHNIDRYQADAGAEDAALTEEKHALLAGAGASHTKPAKLAARRRLQAINRELAAHHPALLAAAAAAVARARQGVANNTVADRRDWCFALYPMECLSDLRQQVADSP